MEGLLDITEPLRCRKGPATPSFLSITLIAHSQTVALQMPSNFHPMLPGGSHSSDKDAISIPLVIDSQRKSYYWLAFRPSSTLLSFPSLGLGIWKPFYPESLPSCF